MYVVAGLAEVAAEQQPVDSVAHLSFYLHVLQQLVGGAQQPGPCCIVRVCMQLCVHACILPTHPAAADGSVGGYQPAAALGTVSWDAHGLFPCHCM